MRPPSTPRVEINCNLFKPCCSQETKVSVRKRGRNGGMGEGGIDLEPLRISNELAGKKENGEQTWGGSNGGRAQSQRPQSLLGSCRLSLNNFLLEKIIIAERWLFWRFPWSPVVVHLKKLSFCGFLLQKYACTEINLLLLLNTQINDKHVSKGRSASPERPWENKDTIQGGTGPFLFVFDWFFMMKQAAELYSCLPKPAC